MNSCESPGSSPTQRSRNQDGDWAIGRANASKPKTVISTEAQAGQWAERSGEPSLRDSPSGRHGGQTSNFSSRGRRRWANAPRLRTSFARKAKIEVSPLRSAHRPACASVEMTVLVFLMRLPWGCAGLSALVSFSTMSWGVAPGWDGCGPLALKFGPCFNGMNDAHDVLNGPLALKAGPCFNRTPTDLAKIFH